MRISILLGFILSICFPSNPLTGSAVKYSQFFTKNLDV